MDMCDRLLGKLYLLTEKRGDECRTAALPVVFAIEQVIHHLRETCQADKDLKEMGRERSAGYSLEPEKRNEEDLRTILSDRRRPRAAVDPDDGPSALHGTKRVDVPSRSALRRQPAQTVANLTIVAAIEFTLIVEVVTQCAEITRVGQSQAIHFAQLLSLNSCQIVESADAEQPQWRPRPACQQHRDAGRDRLSGQAGVTEGLSPTAAVP